MLRLLHSLSLALVGRPLEGNPDARLFQRLLWHGASTSYLSPQLRSICTVTWMAPASPLTPSPPGSVVPNEAPA